MDYVILVFILAFMVVGMITVVDTLWELIRCCINQKRAHKSTTAIQNEPTIFERVEAYLIPSVKTNDYKIERCSQIHKTLSGYTVGIYLEAPKGENLTDLLDMNEQNKKST